VNRGKSGIAAFGIAALVALAMGCASSYNRPLVSRGLPADERKDYVIQNGFGIPENIKQAFLEGYVEVGMGRELVFQLYGAPDRTTGGDANWEYVLDRAIMTTAMNPGLGGGPLLDTLGNVVGVVSLNLNEIGRFSLSIPADYFLDARDSFVSGRSQAPGAAMM